MTINNNRYASRYISPTIKPLLATSVSYWKFNENAGNVAYDSNTTSHNDLTLYNTTWTTGITGSSLSFDGTTSYGVNTSTSSLPANYPLTIIVWLNPNAIPFMWSTICSKDGSWALQINSASYLSLEITGVADVPSNITLPNNAWSHVAITYDGANVIFYINGVQQYTSATTRTLLPGTNAFYVGKESSGYYYRGSIDELKIYNTVLTSSEVLSDYQSSLCTSPSIVLTLS